MKSVPANDRDGRGWSSYGPAVRRRRRRPLRRRLAIEPLEGRLLLATSIFSDGFEAGFPGLWTVGNASGITTAKWGDNTAKAATGARSAFCADNGSDSRTTYDNNLDTYMRRSQVSLVGYDGASLTFQFWLNSEPGHDTFEVHVANQYGVWSNLLTESGGSSTWLTRTLNLDAFAGQNNLTVSFEFTSDGAGVPPGEAGVWLDDVALSAEVYGNPPSEVPPGSGTRVRPNPFGDSSVAADISSGTELDLYAYLPLATASFDVSTSGPLDSQLRVYDCEGQPITGVIDSGPGGESTTRSFSAGSWYYIAVAGHEVETGSYTLSIVGPGLSSTAVSTPGPNYTGTANGVIAGEGEVDYFRVTAPGGTTTFGATVTPIAGFDSFLEVYDASGARLGWNNSGGDGAADSLSGVPITAGATYYVGVSATAQYGTGSYALAVDFDPNIPTDFTASGQFQYLDKVYDDNGYTGVRNPLPIRYAPVEVWEDNGAVDQLLGTTSTLADGTWSFLVPDNADPGGRDIYAKVRADSADAVVGNAVGATYVFTGPTVADWQDGDMWYDAAPDDHNNQPLLPSTDEYHAAFNILDVTIGAHQWMVGAGHDPGKATVRYRVGGTGGSYYSKSNGIIHIFGNSMALPQGDYDDGFDDAVVAHEYGHFVAHRISYDASYGGPHEWDSHVSVELAWSEGWATFLSSVVRGSEWYVDAYYDQFIVSYDALRYHLESPEEFVLTGDDCEGAIGLVLWDIFDAANEPHDAMAAGADEILDVISNPTYFSVSTACGFRQLYDGWVGMGLGNASALRRILEDRGILYWPTMTSLGDAPDPVVRANPLVLTANGVTSPAAILSVSFYRETNAIEGLQTGEGGDALLGTDSSSAGGWTLELSTEALAPGAYTYYAQALDAAGEKSDDERLAPSATSEIVDLLPTVTAGTGTRVWSDPLGHYGGDFGVAVPGEVDVYAFMPTLSGDYVLSTGGTLNTQMRVYDASGLAITGPIDGTTGGESTAQTFVAGQWYYVAVRGYVSDTGPYTLAVDSAEPPAPDLPTPWPLYVGSANGSISYGGNVDYFRITAPALTGSLSVSVTPAFPLDTLLELHDASGVLLYGNNDGGMGGADLLTSVAVTPGATYYVGVLGAGRENTGNYSVDVDFDPDAPFSDPPSGVALTAGSDTGVSSSDRVTRLDNSSPELRLQFQVSGTAAGATVTIYANGTAIGSAVAEGDTTVVTTGGDLDLFDGNRPVTVRQTEPGERESADSPQLWITVDTLAPLPPGAPDLQTTSDTGVNGYDNVTYDVTPTFTVATSSGFFRFYRDGGQVSGDYEPGTSYTSGPESDGSYLYRVSAVDAAGNDSTLSSALTVRIDTAVPSADVVDVTPDPRTNPTASITITFTEAVAGVNLADLTLTRNAGANLLTGAQTLTSSDNVTWTLGNLGGITAEAGAYLLSLTAAGSAITDTAGNALAADASDPWVVSPSNISGTGGADKFEFIAAAPGGNPLLHELKVTLGADPPVSYFYDAAGPVSLNINAQEGADEIKITGGPGTDTSVLYRWSVIHTGQGYSVTANSVETISVDAGAGIPGQTQLVTLYDGGGDDTYTADGYLRTGSMVGPGYNNSAKDFDYFKGAATRDTGTNDRANLYDTAGNDRFVCKGAFGAASQSFITRISGATGGADVFAGEGFEQIWGFSSHGGTDDAVLYGTSGDDRLSFLPQLYQAKLSRPGSLFVYAQDFKTITGYPQTGTDTVEFYDVAAGSDTLVVTQADARMTGLLPSGQPYDYWAPGWDKVYGFATASASTVDKAYLTGTAGADTLLAYGYPSAIGNSGLAKLAPTAGSAYYFETWRFDEVYADAAGGADTVTLADSTGNDTAFLKATDAVLSDGTLNLSNGDLVTRGNYYYKVSGLSRTGGAIDDLVNLVGYSGGTNNRKRITPLDYNDLKFGAWIDI